MKDYNQAEAIIEEYCAVIHRLLADRDRLEQMVIETREEVNSTVPAGLPPVYDLTAENVSDRSYTDMSAFKWYCKMYGKEALADWPY